MKPRFESKQEVIAIPKGLAFDDNRYPATIMTGPYWDSTFAAWYYGVKVELPTGPIATILFENEIEPQ